MTIPIKTRDRCPDKMIETNPSAMHTLWPAKHIERNGIDLQQDTGSQKPFRDKQSRSGRLCLTLIMDGCGQRGGDVCLWAEERPLVDRSCYECLLLQEVQIWTIWSVSHEIFWFIKCNCSRRLLQKLSCFFPSHCWTFYCLSKEGHGCLMSGVSTLHLLMGAS